MRARKHHAIFGCFKFRRLIAEELFSDLSPEALKSLSAISEVVQLKKGQVLVDKGDLFNVFILIKGDAAAKYFNHLTKQQTQTPIFEGEVVGLIETISNSYSMLRIETITPCIFNRIERENLINFLSEQPDLGLKIVRDLSLKLNESYEAIKS